VAYVTKIFLRKLLFPDTEVLPKTDARRLSKEQPVTSKARVSSEVHSTGARGQEPKTGMTPFAYDLGLFSLCKRLFLWYKNK